MTIKLEEINKHMRIEQSLLEQDLWIMDILSAVCIFAESILKIPGKIEQCPSVLRLYLNRLSS